MRKNRSFLDISLYLILLISFTGCSLFPTANPNTLIASDVQTKWMAEVTFVAEIPAANRGNGIAVDILDEVTGLAINPTRYQMNAVDDTHYSVTIPILLGSSVKYRYVRLGEVPAIEYAADNQQVRYRMFQVYTASILKDKVSAWIDTPYQGKTGRIQGKVINQSDNTPLPNILVLAGGEQTLTSADGTFVLDGLAPGIHNMMVYSMDGAYVPFQQEASIAEGLTTPASVPLSPAKLVNVTFKVQVPSDMSGVPVRMAGNLYQIGNMFADLRAGLSNSAARLPVLTPIDGTTYKITLSLPAGTDFRYKYTLGDGFWNAELTSSGAFYTRQMIIPDHDILMDDTVETWKSPGYEPINISVKVPDNTPQEDYISLQLSAYGWSEPIPMWSAGANQWQYKLFSPLHLMDKISYRYCRDDQCGVADDIRSQGITAAGFEIPVTKLASNISDVVPGWAGLSSNMTPISVEGGDILPRNGFLAGMELVSAYHPSWQPRYLAAFQVIKNHSANLVTLTPTWTYTRINPAILEAIPGYDPLWTDLKETIAQGQGVGLNVAIFPKASFSDWQVFWTSAEKSPEWWQMWFDNYKKFILNYTILAAQTGASALVIGGDWLSPAVYGYQNPDGSISSPPDDFKQQWQTLLAEIRNIYHGKIFWMMNYRSQPPAFSNSLDGWYIQFDPSAASSSSPTSAELQAEYCRNLELIKTLSMDTKVVIIQFAMPAIDGATSGCVQSPVSGECINSTQFDSFYPNLSVFQRDEMEQAEAYNAVLSCVAQKDWVDGFVSMGYYPPVTMYTDSSTSIAGNPAFDVVWYWFNKLVKK
ncbi:MAG TPA: hypothetical protein PKW33_08740 [Anaerolineaceae bacterium]|nr:hypothetical protein [Anaerolineaceae bacterium]HPN51661.1 hypothetical protein [Anaerolineaceae bacterium]